MNFFNFEAKVGFEDNDSGREEEDSGEGVESVRFNFDFGLDKLLACDGEKISEPRPASHIPYFPRRAASDDEKFVLPINEEQDGSSNNSSSDSEDKFNTSFKFDDKDLAEAAAGSVPLPSSSTNNRKKEKKKVFQFDELEEKGMELVWTKLANANHDYMMMKAQPVGVFKTSESALTCPILKHRHMVELAPGNDMKIFYDLSHQYPNQNQTASWGLMLIPAQKTVVPHQEMLKEVLCPSREEGLSLWELSQVLYVFPSPIEGIGAVIEAVEKRCKDEVIAPCEVFPLVWAASSRAPKAVLRLLSHELRDENDNGKLLFRRNISVLLDKVLNVNASHILRGGNMDDRDEVCNLWVVEKILGNNSIVEYGKGMAAIPNPARYCHVHPQDVPMIGSALESIFSPERSVRMLGNGFWRVMRVMCWLKLKGFKRVAGYYEAVESFIRQHVPSESATILACKLMRKHTEPGSNNLLLNLPNDIFNYVLIPWIRAPPFDVLPLPGLSSLEISSFMKERF